MKVIVAGSRHCADANAVHGAIASSGFHITEVVSGGARGVDTIGEQWAELHGIPVKRFPADWKRYGNAAGPIRNAEMAEYAEALIAVRYPNSRGTNSMIKIAASKGLLAYISDVKW